MGFTEAYTRLQLKKVDFVNLPAQCLIELLKVQECDARGDPTENTCRAQKISNPCKSKTANHKLKTGNFTLVLHGQKLMYEGYSNGGS